ncbi:MAG TPA: hypothetical protein VMV53_02620 [Acidimicrobiales bacterium]|nr:hypothetical protein [Acidimicrobiales bacterium]
MIGSAVAVRHAIWTYAFWYVLVWAGVSAPFFLVLNRKKRWIARANRLARQSDINLPQRLEDRVAKRLRNEWFATLVLYPLFVGPWSFLSINIGIQNARFWATWFPRLAMLLPTLLVLYSFGTVVIARWNSPGPRRVSHLRKVRPREAFTAAEGYTLVAGVGANIAVVAWGLLRVHSPGRWWILDLAALALAGALWWRMEIAILRHPSAASDATELGWDDVFRFRRIRSLAVGAAWLPPFTVFLLDSMIGQQLTHFQGGSTLPLDAAIAVVVGVYLIFRQGRQQWRLDGGS